MHNECFHHFLLVSVSPQFRLWPSLAPGLTRTARGREVEAYRIFSWGLVTTSAHEDGQCWADTHLLAAGMGKEKAEPSAMAEAVAHCHYVQLWKWETGIAENTAEIRKWRLGKLKSVGDTYYFLIKLPLKETQANKQAKNPQAKKNILRCTHIVPLERKSTEFPYSKSVRLGLSELKPHSSCNRIGQ